MLAFFSGIVYGAEYYLETYDYYLNIPESWEIFSAESDDYLVFQDAAGAAFFQVQTIHHLPAGMRPEEVIRAVLAGLTPEIETAAFVYNGHTAAYGTLRFHTGGGYAEGFVLSIDRGDYYTVLFTYTDEASFGPYMPLLFSCLDGFSYGNEGLFSPGPVSQFYYPFPGDDTRRFGLRFNGKELTVSVDPGEIDASAVMIEREARILAALPSLDIDAWERYYRLIYRDSYQRLVPVAEQIKPHVRGKDDRTVASELLVWLQGFTYLRTGTVSDLQPPLQSVVTASGDCDSLGLLYCILLHHLGIDAVLLVSTEYSHSIAAVDVPGPGARFSFEAKEYLVAELTDDVDIGLIDSTMADPAKWIPITFAARR